MLSSRPVLAPAKRGTESERVNWKCLEKQNEDRFHVCLGCNQGESRFK